MRSLANYRLRAASITLRAVDCRTLPTSATVLPIIGTSDLAHLSNFSIDNYACPDYITLRNLRLAQYNTRGSSPVLLLAPVFFRPKLSTSTKPDQYQGPVNTDRLQEVFESTFCALFPRHFIASQFIVLIEMLEEFPTIIFTGYGPYGQRDTARGKVQCLSYM